MNSTDPLAQLRDIHLPQPVSWWPPAPGWWIVALAGLTVFGLGIFFLARYRQRNRYRRLALRELDSLDNNAPDKMALLETMSVLLRRVALQAYGREEIAPLHGEQWLSFLDRTGKTDRFSQGTAKVLGAGLYQTIVDADPEEVRQIIRNWIKGHRK